MTSGGTGYPLPVGSSSVLYNDGTNTNMALLEKGYATKTGNYTAVASDQILCDTVSASFNISLPAGVIGEEITIVDSKNYFGSNNLIIISSGTEKINSSASNLTLSTNGQAITLVYANATVGWIYKTNSAS